jgi:hypothetical protein
MVSDSYVPAPKPFMPEPAPKVLIVRQVHWYTKMIKNIEDNPKRFASGKFTFKTRSLGGTF